MAITDIVFLTYHIEKKAKFSEDRRACFLGLIDCVQTPFFEGLRGGDERFLVELKTQ